MIWIINWKVFFYILLSLKCGYIIQLTIYKLASLRSLTGRFCFIFSLVGVVGRILKRPHAVPLALVLWGVAGTCVYNDVFL